MKDDSTADCNGIIMYGTRLYPNDFNDQVQYCEMNDKGICTWTGSTNGLIVTCSVEFSTNPDNIPPPDDMEPVGKTPVGSQNDTTPEKKKSSTTKSKQRQKCISVGSMLPETKIFNRVQIPCGDFSTGKPAVWVCAERG